MSFFSKIFKPERKVRYPLPWARGGGFFSVETKKYAGAITSSILDQLIGGVAGSTWTLKHGSTQQFAEWLIFFRHNAGQVLYRLYEEGICYVACDTNGALSLTYEPKKAAAAIYSDDYRNYGRSTRQLLAPIEDYVNNILNAANTSIQKLGVLVLLSPKHDENGNGLSAEEARAAETSLAENYGILDNQNVVKILAHEYAMQTIEIGGGNLKLDERLQSAIKIICGKLRVPYELVPAAIVGNPNQTGVYQQEAEKRLFRTIREYLLIFKNLAKQLGIDVEFDTPDAPQTYERDYEELNKIIIENIAEAEKLGYISHEDAVAQYSRKITAYDDARI